MMNKSNNDTNTPFTTSPHANRLFLTLLFFKNLHTSTLNPTLPYFTLYISIAFIHHFLSNSNSNVAYSAFSAHFFLLHLLHAHLFQLFVLFDNLLLYFVFLSFFLMPFSLEELFYDPLKVSFVIVCAEY